MTQLTGFLAAALAIVSFGTYAVPVKLVKVGDGMVFQWIECAGIVFIGLMAEFIAGSPYRFEPLAMLGGVFWCTGNLTVVPILRLIGLSVGMLTWGVFNLITGWCFGHFGWFVSKESENVAWLNYLGFAVAIFSVGFYAFVEPTTEADLVDLTAEEEEGRLLANGTPRYDGKVNRTSYDAEDFEDTKKSAMDGFIDKLPKSIRTMLGVFLSIIGGIFYGINMIPVQHLQDKYPDANPLSFAFSHYCGIFLASTVYVIIYAISTKNKPYMTREMFLPGLIAGGMWGVAQCGWFVANDNLGLTVTFPMICTGPGMISSLWGVLYFKEIRGSRNFILLGIAFFMTVAGIICITLSKALK